MPVDALQLRRAALTGTTLNREARTIEAVVATDAPIARSGFGAPLSESLRMTKDAVDLSRILGGPVLLDHRQNVRDIVGVVEAVRLEAGRMTATLRIAKGEAGDAILDLLDDQIIRSLSVGFSIQEAEDRPDGQGGILRIATRWTPFEISFVAIPADPGAQTRKENLTMPDPILPITPAPAITPPPSPAPLQTRAGVNAEIRSIADAAGLGADWANAQIDGERTADQARADAFAQMQRRAEPAIRTQTNPATYDNPEFRVRAMGEAAFARYNPAHKPSEESRPFVGLTTRDIAGECLRRAGVNIAGMSTATLITRALHTTSDYPLILGDMMGRSVRAGYQAAPSGLRAIARETTAPDFRAKQRLMLGEAPKLDPVLESGEFTSGSIGEAGESYRLTTFGRIIGLSRQAQINDDLGAFADLARRFGQSSLAREYAVLAELLQSNPVLSDGVALYHATHKNLASSGAAPSETTFNAMRVAMWGQTGLSGELVAVTGRDIVVPPALQTTAEKLIATIQATKTADVNPFATLRLHVEPRLTSATAWYAFAPNEQIDCLEFAYLEGQPGPQIETQAGFDVDGIRIKCRLDFGAGFVDHRGTFKNPGA